MRGAPEMLASASIPGHAQRLAERARHQEPDEGPFPETIVQMHLDGTSRAYIRADGPELQETIDRAVAAEREACAALCDDEGRCFTVDSKHAGDPRAAGKSAAAKCAWRIRQRGGS
jgi:hypothetical protein